jgi:hypothetical protein
MTQAWAGVKNLDSYLVSFDAPGRLGRLSVSDW